MRLRESYVVLVRGVCSHLSLSYSYAIPPSTSYLGSEVTLLPELDSLVSV